ncbi:hypothetical protein ACRAWF_38500 [Streptomyces sp. L7]
MAFHDAGCLEARERTTFALIKTLSWPAEKKSFCSGARAGCRRVSWEVAESDGEVELRVEIQPSHGWRTVWPRIGVRFELPDGTAPVDGAEWFGLGPLESYPDSLRAARTGRFAVGIRDLSVEYARPQETGHRTAVRRLALTTGDSEVLRVEALPDTQGRRPGFTLSRHTPQEVARSGHPFELPDSTSSHLTVDAAQHGLGSRACGPDVWPAFALRPEARTIRLRITAPN